MSAGFAQARLPWLAEPLRRALATVEAHAVLVHGPGGVGQFELAFLLAAGWLCESTTVPLGERPCGDCASCRLVRACSHPDLLVLVPEVSRETLAWAVGSGESDEAGSESSGKRKPSREVRVEALRMAVAFATTTSARGRVKVVVVHPAERMNPIAANAFLKTLEEPVGAVRFVLSSAAPERLLPTIRSRCQSIRLAVPDQDVATAWLEAHGVDAPGALLVGCGGRPQDALEWAARGLDAAAWRGLPGRVAEGDAAALRGWPLSAVVDALQRICHDALAVSHGAAARFFPAGALAPVADPSALLRWSRELTRVAEWVEHPVSLDLAVEALVGQGREALKTARSPRRGSRAASLNSAA